MFQRAPDRLARFDGACTKPELRFSHRSIRSAVCSSVVSGERSRGKPKTEMSLDTVAGESCGLQAALGGHGESEIQLPWTGVTTWYMN